MTQNRNRANRQNARRSTGPKTDRGKAIVRSNALKHGLRAEQVTIFEERPEDFEALHNSVIASLNPQDPIQESLAQRIAICLWRLRRIPNLEAGILKYQALRRELNVVNYQIEQEIKTLDSAGYGLPRLAEPSPNLKRRRTQLRKKLGEGQAAYGKAFCDDIESFDALGKLSRYETQISRELYQALNQFERLQAKSQVLDLKPQSSSE